MSDQQWFNILTVCTGNICRSPAVEKMLQSGLDAIAPNTFRVNSAGTRALVGLPIESSVASTLQTMAIETSEFSAKQITTELIAEQDLILALTREHRSEIVNIAPSALRKTYTLRELARILPNIKREDKLESIARWTTAVHQSRRLRTANAVDARMDDVVDPYYKDAAVHAQMFDEIHPAVTALLNFERNTVR
ncbi:low molecular weight phosphatase family protein [Arthrobacter ruber]|uniref:arsenate reductase/protein-tyrosine-phosphatase family protein n=1 Tax=Arthrobacter ruber TaxID=1258893 RepID=UPI000CF3E054|nr:low molecular weight phosphatase family protein [Arthrobacter ruber]